MTLRARIFSYLTLTLLSLGVLGAIISSYLPTQIVGSTRPIATNSIFFVLYTSFFGFFLGIGSLMGYAFRYSSQKTIYPSEHWPVFRQATLIAVGLVAALILQGMRVLTWWDGVLLIIALGLVELSFRTRPTS